MITNLLLGETVHHIITHNCNNDYESSPGGETVHQNYKHNCTIMQYNISGGGEITGAIMITNLLLVGRRFIKTTHTIALLCNTIFGGGR